jgi:hypothetical protein
MVENGCFGARARNADPTQNSVTKMRKILENNSKINTRKSQK